MLLLAVLLSAAPLSQARLVGDRALLGKFSDFKKQFGREYASSEEEQYRLRIFADALDFIEQHNAEEGHTYTVGLNAMADLTRDEFLSTYTMTGFSAEEHQKQFTALAGAPGSGALYRDAAAEQLSAPVANGVDWRGRAVTSVKNQGSCGSCWTFATAGAVEGSWAVSRGSLQDLSTQQLLDCSNGYGNKGCSGGFMTYAYQYIYANGGICSWSSYPYQGAVYSCRACTPVARITSYSNVAANSPASLVSALNGRPVAVAIDAGSTAFQYYTGGVFNGACSFSLNHAVLAVGYGTTSTGSDYWIVKNSWGTGWGESGYVRMLRSYSDSRGMCGICMAASYTVS